jgi:hypothetical protein
MAISIREVWSLNKLGLKKKNSSLTILPYIKIWTIKLKPFLKFFNKKRKTARL